MKPIEEKIVRMLVVDKNEGTKGLIFKKPQYLVTLLALDEKDITQPPKQVEVPFHKYHRMEVNSEIDTKLYSSDGENWYFSKQVAELLRKNDLF